MKHAITCTWAAWAGSSVKQSVAIEMFVDRLPVRVLPSDSSCPRQSIVYPSPFVFSRLCVICLDPATASCDVTGTRSGSPGTILRNNVKVQGVARAHNLKKTLYQFPYE
jgi:hypothetical protein